MIGVAEHPAFVYRFPGSVYLRRGYWLDRVLLLVGSPGYRMKCNLSIEIIKHKSTNITQLSSIILATRMRKHYYSWSKFLTCIRALLAILVPNFFTMRRIFFCEIVPWTVGRVARVESTKRWSGNPKPTNETFNGSKCFQFNFINWFIELFASVTS